MENVLYIIGAGFSAPLGIPVMSDFMAAAKDMFAKNSEKYNYFHRIFKKVNDLHTIKTYINSDLLNIEEVLSLLEMNGYVGHSGKTVNELKQFIKDVISFYTPLICFNTLNQPYIEDYTRFVERLLNILIGGGAIKSKKGTDLLSHSYAVITLNYDLIIESCIDYFQSRYPCVEKGMHIKNGFTKQKTYEKTISETDYYSNPEIDFFLSLAKIHGSVDSDIIPPTWNKTSNKAVKDVWKLARILIENANQIRFLGYSLPITDTHFNYLLKSGIMKSKNLKKIDALCLDNEIGSVEKRYRELIVFNKFRFQNRNIIDYIQGLNRSIRKYDDLESWHEEIFTS